MRTTTFGDGSPSISRTYTPDGLLATITSNGSTWTNTYNRRRLNEKERLTYGGVNYDYDRQYDANGSVLRVRYPLDSTWLDYSPNALGEARQIGNYATAITYHPNGAVTSFRYGNGIAHSMSTNRRGLPEWSVDAGVLQDRYTYDANGNVRSIEDWQEGITNRGLEYDNLNRLVHVNDAPVWGDAWYTYDALDNLTSSRITAGPNARTLTHTINPTTNLLDSITNSAGGTYNLAFKYDDLGNVKQRGTQTFTFDLGNRLASASGKGTYVYDGLGHRVSAVGTDGVNWIHVYSQEGQLLFVKPTVSAIGTKYIYLGNHIIAEVGGTVQYDHTDGLGSPVAYTDSAGRLLGRTRYEPYGATAAGLTPAIGYTGHVNAPELGLVYMQQRYFDPVAGHFLSIDPVVTDANTGGSFNRYAYANNSPYKYIDPDGRDARDDQIAADLKKIHDNFCNGQCSGGVSSALFKLNPQQVAFDVRAIQRGAQTALGVTVNSVMYRGAG
ncbi:RHS repeat-associated core domain-containing protein [Massilia solisilvae]|uniref:RHS repeat-associated core domain-containing protein n=1 Tax=Massilia solisilvae TaxID=1811225 RepID=A0ABT2BRE7_9BURK|nr:RHS repeat-associated core domain-containing protein [Massilia solisilvae]MCS0611087.1 RHS repeat-associated core domain-containing protein [Massilia solisilvae]